VRRLIFEPEHEEFRKTVRHFMQTEVAPHAERWREAGMVDREIYLKAGSAGLLCTWAEECYGGAGINDFRFEQIIVEENMRHGDLGFYIHLHNDLVAPYIAELGTQEQKDRFLPGIIAGEKILAVAMTEPSTGSDLAGIRTSAVRQLEGHWLLNGAKTYISNGLLGDVIVVAARTDPVRPHGISLFIVERGMAGFERGRKLAKMG
jgi:acyl-CoA dehydrogenase